MRYRKKSSLKGFIQERQVNATVPGVIALSHGRWSVDGPSQIILTPFEDEKQGACLSHAEFLHCRPVRNVQMQGVRGRGVRRTLGVRRSDAGRNTTPQMDVYNQSLFS
jgi:hypothetical protein